MSIKILVLDFPFFVSFKRQTHLDHRLFHRGRRGRLGPSDRPRQKASSARSHFRDLPEDVEDVEDVEDGKNRKKRNQKHDDIFMFVMYVHF